MTKGTASYTYTRSTEEDDIEIDIEFDYDVYNDEYFGLMVEIEDLRSDLPLSGEELATVLPYLEEKAIEEAGEQEADYYDALEAKYEEAY